MRCEVVGADAAAVGHPLQPPKAEGKAKSLRCVTFGDRGVRKGAGAGGEDVGGRFPPVETGGNKPCAEAAKTAAGEERRSGDESALLYIAGAEVLGWLLC